MAGLKSYLHQIDCVTQSGLVAVCDKASSAAMACGISLNEVTMNCLQEFDISTRQAAIKEARTRWWFWIHETDHYIC